VNKSKVNIFRLGGHLARFERWYCGEERTEVVNQYRYLGAVFSTKLCTHVTLEDLANRGKFAALYILKTLRMLNNMSLDVFIRMVDSQVQAILLWASEVRGLETCDKIECVLMTDLLQSDLCSINEKKWRIVLLPLFSVRPFFLSSCHFLIPWFFSAMGRRPQKWNVLL